MGKSSGGGYDPKAAEALELQAEIQRQALEEQKKMNTLKASRDRREAFREARAAQGSAIQAGAATGTMGSSGLMGGVSSIGAQLGSNVSFLDEMQTMASNISDFNMEAARQGSLAQQYQMKAQASRARAGGIGSLIGAGIGFAVGGPMGASLGASLGSTGGQLLG